MVLGVDFDNTIVRYDDLFHRVAVERGLIPSTLPPFKNDVRNFLRAQNLEQAWTELQGYVYGPRMAEAQPFPGVLEFFARAVWQGLPLYIISHKTRTAVEGPAYDLQQTARQWLAAQGFFDPSRVGLSPARVHFGATRVEKIRSIRENNCTHFIDDLEETFLEESFPPSVAKILFGRREPPPGLPAVKSLEDWPQVSEHIFNVFNTAN
jgi:hypothetical protein